MSPPRTSLQRTLLAPGVAAILIALPYLSGLMPVEGEIVLWAAASVVFGMVTLRLARSSQVEAMVRVIMLVLGIIALMQVPPIWLWIGSGITTDHPFVPRGIATRVVLAIAHAAVLVLAARAMISAWRLRRLGDMTG